MLQSNIEYGCGKGDPGIQLFLEDQRNAFAEHIAQYAAEDTGDHGGNRGDNRAFAHVQGDLRADDGKHDQPQRVQHQKQPTKVRHHRSGNGREDGGDGDNDDIFGMLHPTKRIVPQQDIANGTPAQRGRSGDNDDAKRIHPPAPGSQCAGHGFRGDTD
ncbi:Uncharacterised protein [Klebsiella pneumoniae]|nr:Uncharacterised protein [Klebsiella pneumoniae]